MTPYRPLGWVTNGRGAFTEFRTYHHLTHDGRPVRRDRLVFPQAAVVVPVLDDRVFLVRQWREGAGRQLLELPAGLIEPGETPEACAARECDEEVGLVPRRLEALGAWWPSPGISTERIHVFLATDLTVGERRPDGPEEAAATVVELPFADAHRAVLGGEIHDMKTVAALLMAAERLTR